MDTYTMLWLPSLRKLGTFFVQNPSNEDLRKETKFVFKIRVVLCTIVAGYNSIKLFMGKNKEPIATKKH